MTVLRGRSHLRRAATGSLLFVRDEGGDVAEVFLLAVPNLSDLPDDGYHHLNPPPFCRFPTGSDAL